MQEEVARTSGVGTVRRRGEFNLRRWRSAGRALTEQLGRAPTDDELAAHLGWGPRRRALLQRARAIGRRGDGVIDCGFAALVAAPVPTALEAVIAAETMAGHAEDVRRLRGRVPALPAPLATIVALRFGLPPFEKPATYGAIGARFGRSGGWAGHQVRQALTQIAQEARGATAAPVIDESGHPGFGGSPCGLSGAPGASCRLQPSPAAVFFPLPTGGGVDERSEIATTTNGGL